jgi:hypothetical protein
MTRRESHHGTTIAANHRTGNYTIQEMDLTLHKLEQCIGSINACAYMFEKPYQLPFYASELRGILDQLDQLTSRARNALITRAKK